MKIDIEYLKHNKCTIFFRICLAPNRKYTHFLFFLTWVFKSTKLPWRHPWIVHACINEVCSLWAEPRVALGGQCWYMSAHQYHNAHRLSHITV